MAKAKRAADYNGIFAVRLRECLENQEITQQELADCIGKTRQAVNYYTLGETVPDADTLILIARRLNVSVDYLLGLTDAATLNTSIQDIHHITGLSEKAIDKLIFIKDPVYNSSSELEEKGFHDKEWLKTINFLIETAITNYEDMKGYYIPGLISELSAYYSAYSSENKQEVYILPTGKIFTDIEEAKKGSEQLMKNGAINQVRISCVEVNEMLENMWIDRLTKRIRESKDAYFEYVDSVMGDKPEKK